MPFFKKIKRAALAVLVSLLGSTVVHALEDNRAMHWSAKKQFWDRGTGKVELFGEATVRQPNETLIADYMILDQKAQTLDAKGNCIYITPDSTVFGDEMQFNLDSRTGTIIGARISSQAFTLGGERIHKISDSRFKTRWGEYSTCRDCPRSWSILAEDVDMEVDGYAHMKNVTTKIRDVPAFWLPYLIVPVKTRRQSGLLFPTFRLSSSDGLVYVQPYFWAINDHADMTFSLGTFSNRGRRGQWEGRYLTSERSGGIANFYSSHDRTFENRTERWGLDLKQLQELPWGIEERLKITEVSDTQYTFSFPGDLSGYGSEPYLKSELSFSKPTDDFSAFIAGKRYRNLINLDPSSKRSRDLGFDNKMVQLFPSAAFSTNDRFLFGTPISTGVNFSVANFTRTSEAADIDETILKSNPNATWTPGRDPIRKATRIGIEPSLYTTLRPFDVTSLVPSAKLKSYYYNFPPVLGETVPDLYRGYVLLQTDWTTQFEKIYEWKDDDNIPRTKHLIRPQLTYSLIPQKFEHWNNSAYSSHPFVTQTTAKKGYIFDQNDIIPMDVTPETEKYYYPLGNALAYGFTSQVIRKTVDDAGFSPSYSRTVEVTGGQSVSFRELKKPIDQRRFFSRAFSSLSLSFDKFTSGSFYYYYPYAKYYHHALTHDSTYTFESGYRQRILQYERSVGLGFTWDQTDSETPSGGTKAIRGKIAFSLNDYLLPIASATWDVLQKQISSMTVDTIFQSPSVCWKFGIKFVKAGPGIPWDRQMDLAINLTGNSFGGVNETQNMIMTK